MRTNALKWIAALVLPALLLPAAADSTVAAQRESRTFAETGKTVQGRFLRYWQEHGGVAQQGYPVSGEMQERSQTDGKLYTVQYFERAVFELHPENVAPNDVLLSLLGTFAYRESYPDGAPGQRASAANPQRFSQTGKTLGGKFREYWERKGGLAQQGYPISDEFMEKNALDGETYLVQYFERAVFELHPENDPPYDVLLSQLGKYRFDRLTAGNAKYLKTLDAVWRDVRDGYIYGYIYKDFRGQDWDAVGERYRERVAEATSEEEAYRLISHMIVGLDDRHSHFQDPAVRKQAEDARRGRISLVGIGASLQEIEGGRRVSFVYPGGPAEQAGLRVYDTIRAIDGRSLAEDPEAVRLVRGPAGSSVRLLVESYGEAPLEVTVVRGEVRYEDKIVSRRLPSTNVVYVDIPTFIVEGIAGQVRDALVRAIASGPVDGVIVDVRLNSGGAGDELMEALSMFVD
ncbi:MAG TPA: PDZ domain-containing protein, partial [Chloroflexia bacterium]|nr:PDZ domain-containing protein [Chloroflexia bacterium]